tara:strand:- start:37 stop:960 length:924 start_codon:yes stop_codon:yes gene_type:complete
MTTSPHSPKEESSPKKRKIMAAASAENEQRKQQAENNNLNAHLDRCANESPKIDAAIKNLIAVLSTDLDEHNAAYPVKDLILCAKALTKGINSYEMKPLQDFLTNHPQDENQTALSRIDQIAEYKSLLALTEKCKQSKVGYTKLLGKSFATLQLYDSIPNLVDRVCKHLDASIEDKCWNDFFHAWQDSIGFGVSAVSDQENASSGSKKPATSSNLIKQVGDGVTIEHISKEEEKAEAAPTRDLSLVWACSSTTEFKTAIAKQSFERKKTVDERVKRMEQGEIDLSSMKDALKESIAGEPKIREVEEQ